MPKSRDEVIQEVAVGETKRLIDEGKLIESGFALLRHHVMAKDAPDVQVSEMRFAFMAGAEHVFSSLMAVMDAGDDVTEDDMRRMDLIGKEIEAWRDVISQRVDPRKVLKGRR